MSRWYTPVITFTALGLFWLAVSLQDDAPPIFKRENTASVVIPAAIQVILYGGDRFLASDIESIRSTIAATDTEAMRYRLQAHQVASELNPCQEDNYWVGNASLSWGGAQEQGFAILRNAIHCRVWDGWPAFFYGFNQDFFHGNVTEAQRALEIAADRSPENAAAFRTFATMLVAGKINNARLAVKMLEDDRDKARDPKLREMLDKRVTRMRGLLTLREAQAEYEKRFGKKLNHPQELLSSGILHSFPNDPLKLGYEFRNHAFQLHEYQVK